MIQKNQKQPVFHGREKHFLISAIDLSDPEIHLIFPHGHKLGSLFSAPEVRLKMAFILARSSRIRKGFVI